MWEAGNQLTTMLEELSEVVQAIEDEQIKRFAGTQSLTQLERYVRDTLLGLLASDFPEMVSDFSELNQLYDDHAAPNDNVAQEMPECQRQLVMTGTTGDSKGW